MKKAIIILLLVLIVLAGAFFAAYEIGLRFAADKAVETIITSEINEMLDSGEITMDDIVVMVEDEPEDEAIQAEVQEESTNSQSTENKKSETISDKKKQETVKKAAEKANEDIAARDKREVMELIRSNLTTEDMKFLLSALKGGVTRQEIKQAAKIAYSRFDKEEIVRVKEFWHKYKDTMIKRAKE